MNKRPIVLVLNCGSSSVKYQVIDMSTETTLAKGIVERVGTEEARITHDKTGSPRYRTTKPVATHKTAVGEVLTLLTDPEMGVIESVKDIVAVGHRVVHAGERFSGSVMINKETKQALIDCVDLAPLHNPANIIGIEAAEEAMPGIPQAGTFDTAFHQTMPIHAFLYGLPIGLYRKYGMRRYGFHGTSHYWVSKRAAELLGKPIEETKIITCHLGNGASMAAVMGGKSVDTSMGFTPLEGLVMGTRCGDIDPAIVTFLMRKENLTSEQVDDLLNKESGVRGLAQMSHDMRDVEAAAEQGNRQAQITLDVYNYKIIKYIGAYAAAMNGVDAIVFTAGVGENSPYVREQVCKSLTYLGVDFDYKANEGLKGKERELTLPGSKVKVYAIPTNEELVIAQDALKQVMANRACD
jgi:acetate kinase